MKNVQRALYRMDGMDGIDGMDRMDGMAELGRIKSKDERVKIDKEARMEE